VKPGLKGRAAYAAGVRTANPKVRLLTNFSGTQDDNAVSRRIALAEIDAGADIIFTMLNAGRTGATQACRERGVKEIGNVGDWVAIDPDVFIASAVADVSKAVFNAVRDFSQGRLQPGTITRISLEDPEAVRLSLGKGVPAEVAQRIAQYRLDILAGRIVIPESYEGPEFNPA
jgi:basic membrane protein A